jgi:hypothetical protein
MAATIECGSCGDHYVVPIVGEICTTQQREETGNADPKYVSWQAVEGKWRAEMDSSSLKPI